MDRPVTREKQYQDLLDLKQRIGFDRLGLMSNQIWHDDPRRLGFVLARYKFVAKMLSGRRRVAEVGCADAFATRVVLQEVHEVTAFDFDPVFIEDVRAHGVERWPVRPRLHDIVTGPLPDGPYDGVYSLDVLEHIPAADERRYVTHLAQSLAPHGVLIIGSPSLESQAYASTQSVAGHVNCKRGPDLKAALEEFFHTVFVFSMNDEVVHTGFFPMAHYLLAVCCEPRAM